MSGEKRRSKRKALKYPARIDAGDGTAFRECMLCDVSESGARVLLKVRENVPERFTLLLGTEGAAPRLCEVVWRDGAELGLRFKKNLNAAQQPLLRSRQGR